MAMPEAIREISREETAAIAHLRGWCHLGPTCPICTSERRAMAFWKAQGRAEAIREIAEGPATTHRAPYGMT